MEFSSVLQVSLVFLLEYLGITREAQLFFFFWGGGGRGREIMATYPDMLKCL